MKGLLRIILMLTGVAIGPGVVALFFEVLHNLGGIDVNVLLFPWAVLTIYVISAVISGIIFIFISKGISQRLYRAMLLFEKKVLKAPPKAVAAGFIGLILGLLVALLFSTPISSIPLFWISIPLSLLVYCICGYLGSRIAMRSLPRMQGFFDARSGKNRFSEDKTAEFSAAPKILDTSVIIDGRIFDICKTGILEGTLLVPEFVLSELRHIADSADSLKRGKGRRGLDILNKMQKELNIDVQIIARDYDDIPEVDAKLLRLAQESEGTVITNDFNLNKVAAVQGVRVFNINELANAVKPVMLPGEELTVTIVKEGKENAQGVAYLEDGTMIVVENARDRIGEQMEVAVTSVLQTAAGRMIFARGKA